MLTQLRTTRTETPLSKRIRDTAALFARRRYVVPLEEFSACLLGGAASPDDVQRELASLPDVSLTDGFIILRGQDVDLDACRTRRAMHQAHRDKILPDAVSFAQELVQTLPGIKAICLTGSLCSHGYIPSDDVDFNLYVDDRWKYAAYLSSFLLSLKYSLKYRNKIENEEGKTPLLPKVICINVIFRDSDCMPFVRRDRYLGFELFLQEPLYGTSYCQEVFAKNEWLQSFFPQMGERLAAHQDRVSAPTPSLLHRLWEADALGLGEKSSRLISRSIFSLVQLSRLRNPAARQHVARVRQFQYPYGVFQKP